MTVDRLVSPHGFDGEGPVPTVVTQAAKRIAQLRVKFLTTGELASGEVDEVFDAAAIQAEWMREMYEAIHGGQQEGGSDDDGS